MHYYSCCQKRKQQKRKQKQTPLRLIKFTRQVTIPNGEDFRTGPYFIMHTLLCFMKTIAITIDVLWGCGALFFPFRGFFSKSIWTLKKPVELLSEIRKIEQFFLQFRHFSCNFTHFSVISARSGVSSNRCNRVQIRKHNKQTK